MFFPFIGDIGEDVTGPVWILWIVAFLLFLSSIVVFFRKVCEIYERIPKAIFVLLSLMGISIEINFMFWGQEGALTRVNLFFCTLVFGMFIFYWVWSLFSAKPKEKEKISIFYLSFGFVCVVVYNLVF